MSSVLEIARFACDTTPFAIYSFRMEQENRECLASIDPEYYRHVARINEAALITEEKQYAAVQLRAAYSQALETLFALLGCVAQAPHCPVGWLLCYHSAGLYNLVRKISAGEAILTRLRTKPVTWGVLARVVLNADYASEEQRQAVLHAFGSLWRSLAQEWADPQFTEEYNSVKHGLRARMHGYYLALGPEDTPGVAAPPERMVTIASSEFGLGYFSTVEALDKRNLKLQSVGNNWNPQRFVVLLDLIATSIANVLAFLQRMNGVPAEQLHLEIPGDLALFDDLYQYHAGSGRMSWTSGFDITNLNPLSKEEILGYYDETDEDSVDTPDASDSQG